MGYRCVDILLLLAVDPMSGRNDTEKNESKYKERKDKRKSEAFHHNKYLFSVFHNTSRRNF
jgi:hypothetical protein